MNHPPLASPITPPRRLRRPGLLVLAAALLSAAAPAATVRGQDGADALQTLPDFKVDLVLKADKAKHGSWISLGQDNKGRLLLGGQRGQPLTRVTLSPDGTVAKEEVLKLPVSEVMGSLWAYDALYVNASDGKTFALHRLRESADGTWADETLREWKGGAGEHGAHGILLGKDGLLYTVCGNFVDVPADVLPTSPHRNYSDDHVQPRAEDGNGFGAGRKPPGGFVLRMDKDGKNPELFASGQRNTYDIAFSAHGELFGFDSDMEWDWGTAWYRPTRVYQITSGADHGFREGTGKWPEYYPDSLPAVVNIGVGSPTGVVFGTGAKFPAKYQTAFYVLDWSYGRVMAAHLKPQGAGYTATFENFVAPKGLTDKGGKKSPNNVTDVVVGSDGALYFTTGGRNTPGNLYRVTYTGKDATTPAPADFGDNADAAAARGVRREIEQYHREANPKAVDAVWRHLGSTDRYLRYAARIALERQPVDQWQARALAEKDPPTALTALLALARVGTPAVHQDLLFALLKLPSDDFTEQQQLDKIRVAEVSIARQGRPTGDVRKLLTSELSARFPAKTYPLNRELSQTLLALEAPDAVAKTVKLLNDSEVQEEQVGYVLALRSATAGWTPELRKAYFGWWAKADRSKLAHAGDTVKWFEEAGRAYADGSSFPRFLGNFHAEAIKTLTPAESAELKPVLAAYVPPGPKPAKKPAKEPKFVKEWTLAELEPLVKEPLKRRNFDRGTQALTTAQCLACHKFGNEGGAIGPDITALASRFSRRDILESIVEPSKVISEQLANTDVRLKDGDVVSGRILEDKADKLIVLANPLKPAETTTVLKADIKSVGLSKLSPMPTGLVNVLTKDEILDLVALLESGGNKSHPAFAK
jgi:putative heme-binding domain-containing protein